MSLEDNFPGLFPQRHGLRNRLRNFKILKTQAVHAPRDIISTILVGLGIVSAGTAGAAAIGITIGGVVFGLTLSGWISLAVIIGLTVWSMMAGGKTGGTIPPLDQNGQLVNTRQAAKVLPVIYGIARVGGNWVFSRPSSANNNILNNVMTWCEGEIEGLSTAIDYTPLYSGTTGLNDIHTGGEFVYAACTCNGVCDLHTDCVTCDIAHH
jgi:hypothetical protein